MSEYRTTITYKDVILAGTLERAEAKARELDIDLAAYYRALVRAGCSEEDAFELTIDCQRTMLLRTAPE